MCNFILAISCISLYVKNISLKLLETLEYITTSRENTPCQLPLDTIATSRYTLRLVIQLC